ncbi:hypothetical protein MRX96_014344 [Rhipicephalus microplus]
MALLPPPVSSKCIANFDAASRETTCVINITCVVGRRLPRGEELPLEGASAADGCAREARVAVNGCPRRQAGRPPRQCKEGGVVHPSHLQLSLLGGPRALPWFKAPRNGAGYYSHMKRPWHWEGRPSLYENADTHLPDTKVAIYSKLYDYHISGNLFLTTSSNRAGAPMAKPHAGVHRRGSGETLNSHKQAQSTARRRKIAQPDLPQRKRLPLRSI